MCQQASKSLIANAIAAIVQCGDSYDETTSSCRYLGHDTTVKKGDKMTKTHRSCDDISHEQVGPRSLEAMVAIDGWR
jgi:hypothetical protein